MRVELCADGVMGSAPVRQEMNADLSGQLASASRRHAYSAAVSAARSPADYTARVIPHCSGVAVPLEAPQILWQPR
jgi:starch phosphorylase